MPSPEGLLKISELAEKAGVSTGTIRFYIREGLLPRPTLKTSRNMAYYDPSFVERIRFIRRLQEERRLPLGDIRALVKSKRGKSDPVPTLLELEAELATVVERDAGEPLTRDQLVERASIDPEELDDLVDMGMLTPRGAGARARFGPEDVAIAEVVGRARAMGLTRELFPTRDLAIYKDALVRLVAEETRLLARRLRGKTLPAPVHAITQTAMSITGELIARLRRKLIVDLLAGLERGAS